MSTSALQLDFTMPINLEILHEFHTSSKKTFDLVQKDSPPPNKQNQKFTLYFYGSNKTQEQSFRELINIETNGEKFLEPEHFFTLLAIIKAYTDFEYLGIMTAGHHDKSIDEMEKHYLPYHKNTPALLKKLRNLLYMRDIYKGSIKMKIECMELSEKGQEFGKDTEHSVLLDSDVHKSILELAIENLIRSVKLEAPFNPFLPNINSPFSNEAINLQNYSYVNKEYERSLKGNSKKRPSIATVFRSNLRKVISDYLDKYALIEIKPVNKGVITYELLKAFSLIPLEKVIQYKTNKDKYDYIKTQNQYYPVSIKI